MSLRRFFPSATSVWSYPESVYIVSVNGAQAARSPLPRPILALQAHPRDGGGLTAFNVIVNTSGHGLGLCASNSYYPSVTRPSTIMSLASGYLLKAGHFVSSITYREGLMALP